MADGLPFVNMHLHFFRKESFAADTIREMDEAKVEKSLLVALPEVEFMDGITGGNEEVLGAIAGNPQRFVGCMYVDPREGNSLEILNRYHNEGFRCVKMFPPLGFTIDDDRCKPILERMDTLKLPLLLHTGQTNLIFQKGGKTAHTHSLYARPMTVDGPARSYPNVKFILAHSGFPYYLEAWSVAMANPNVYLEVNGMDTGWDRAMVPLYNAINRSIPIDYERLVWGTDNIRAPAESMGIARRQLREMGMADEFTPKVFGETGRRILAGVGTGQR